MKLSVDQSRYIKGIAILMMVYFHLFMPYSNADACSYLIYVGDVPLLLLLSRAASPVYLYLLMSGYGLFSIWKQGKELKPLKRCLDLYYIYWVSLIVMVGVASYVKPDVYPGTIVDVIKNATGWETTYNAEAWFLFPYILLVLSAKWLFPLVNRYPGYITCGATYGLFLIAIIVMFFVSKSGDMWLFNTRLVYYPFLYMECMCPFLFGCVMCKYSETPEPDKLLHVLDKNWKVLLLLLFTVMSRCIIETTIYGPIYALGVFFLLSHIQWKEWQSRVLGFFGRHSTTIWLTHSYFCYYLFHDFVYGLRWPFLIVLVTLVGSLFASYMIILLCKFFRI